MVSGWHWSSKWHGKVQTVIQDGGQSQKHWHEHPWRPKNMLQWTLSTISFAPHTTYAFLHNLALKPHHLPKHKYLNSGSTSKSLHLFAHPTCTTLVLLFTVTHTHTHTHTLSIRLYSTLCNHLHHLHKNLHRPAEWICVPLLLWRSLNGWPCLTVYNGYKQITCLRILSLWRQTSSENILLSLPSYLLRWKKLAQFGTHSTTLVFTSCVSFSSSSFLCVCGCGLCVPDRS